MPVGAIVMLVVVGIAWGSNRPTAPSTTPAAPATADALGSAAAVHAPRVTLLPAPAPPAPSGPLTTFGDGTWEVGVDIQSGKYKTAGPAPGGFGNCYHARLNTGDGSLGDIIDNNNSKGPVTVTIKESDSYFETQGCADWVKADQ